MNYPKQTAKLMHKNKRRQGLALAVCLALGVLSSPLYAQDALLGTEPPLERGQQLLNAGSYIAAIDSFQRVNGFDEEAALLGLGRAYGLTGQYEEGIALLEDEIGAYAISPVLSTQLAELLRTTGQSARALDILEEVVSENTSPPVRALVQYGSLLQFVGRRDEAIAPLNAAIARYDNGLVFDSEEIAMVALASWLLDRFHDANSLFSEATRVDPNNLEAQVLWGDLFMEKFNTPDAEKSYDAALAINRRYGPALIGQAKISGGERSLSFALSVNERDVKALETMATLLVLNNRQEDAEEFIEAALEINPESIKSLSLKATQAAMKEEFAEFAQLEAQVKSFSPNNPHFYGDIADAFGNNYRFTEAVGYARQAIAADPNYWQGHTLLGTNLIRLGEEEAGRESLELAFDNDPFNVMTSNMLKVFDTLEEYATLRTEHFEVRMSQSDAVVLWPYMAPLIEENWATLTEKYGFEPEAPVLIEIFDRTEDFAVRSVGLPDIGPLVGICFGKVVTLISPATLDANWQEILWHELVHVFTLQMTNNRMPRWLSEGISTWEEREARPEWGRRQGIELVRAVEDEKLLPVASLNEGFTGANSNEDLGFAYFQSYLVVDFIAKEYGFEKMVELINQYALIKEESEMFSTVFGKPVEEFDADFRSWIDRRVSEIDVYVHNEDAADEGAAHGHGQRENSSAVLAELYNNASLKQHMRQRVQDQPRDFQAHLQLGIVLFKEELFEEAKVHLEIADEILPDYSGYPSPPLVLSQIYERQGDDAARIEQLKRMMVNQQHDYDSAVLLAKRALEAGDTEEADYYVQRALSVSPYRLDVHQVSAQIAALTENSSMAVREFEVLVTLDRNDPVEARTNLAEAYMNNGQAQEAKRNILTALEIAPSYQRAQQVLLKAVDSVNEQ